MLKYIMNAALVSTEDLFQKHYKIFLTLNFWTGQFIYMLK